MPRDAERAESTGERILDAATVVFLEKGQAGARMREIAEAAGINKALLHYYFRSKEGLYRAVLERELSSFLRGVVSAVPADVDDIERFLRGMIDNLIDGLAANPQVIRFITWELGRGGPVARELIGRIVTGGPGDSIFDRFVSLVETERNRGRIRDVDPLHLVLSVIGMCLYVYLAAPIVSAVFGGVEPRDPAFVERRKREVFELAWRGIRARKEGDDA